MTDLEKLISFLRLHSLRSGEEFTLASGEKSTVYVDVKKTALNGVCQKLLAKFLWEKIISSFHKHHGITEAVAGVALGGCHLSSIVAMHAPYDLDVIHVRKEAKNHGTQNLLECPRLSPYQQVVLIEDVITTGTSVIKAARALEQAGLNLLGIIAVVDRRKEKSQYLIDGNTRWPIVTLVNFEQLIESA